MGGFQFPILSVIIFTPIVAAMVMLAIDATRRDLIRGIAITAAAIVLVLAWKVAGYYGADFVLLRWLGVPWWGSDEKLEPSTPNPTGQFKPSAS